MSRLLPACGAVIGVMGASLAIVVARSGDNAETAYAGTTWVASAATFVAALALFGASLVVRSRTIAALAFAAGVCWLAPVAVGWLSGPPPIRATATIAQAFTLVLLVHLALASTGQLERRGARLVVVAAYVWATLSSVLLALVRDPFYDPRCWADCDGNAFLVRSWRGLADALVAARPWAGIVLGVAVAALGAAHLRRSTGIRWLSGLGATAVGTVAILHAIGLLTAQREDPLDPALRAVYVAAAATAVVVALALATPRLEIVLRRRAVARVVAALDQASAPGELERTLGTALGDRELRLAFSLPEGGRCVDAAGRDCARPVPEPGRVVTPLVRDRVPVAWIDHDAAVAAAIESSLTPAVRLAIDNARLRLGLAAQLRELRVARRRIVGDGDDERRRIERDLHDGVQQQLLALAAELRAGARLARVNGHSVARALEAGVHETGALLDEVRELAHGIYPAILTDAGLGPAIASLADVAGLPVRIARAPTRRYTSSVEATAYRIVAEGIDNAVFHSDAMSVAVDISDADGSVLVDVHDDGHGGAAVKEVGGLAELVDRVGAIDGTISVQSSAGGTTIRAVIPCAS